MQGEFLLGEGHGGGGKTNESLIFERFGEFDQGIFFVVH
jgi:hypothetical protein